MAENLTSTPRSSLMDDIMSHLEDEDDGPSELDEKIRNLTGILQDKFPNVNLNDIPGLTPSTGANFLFFMCSLILCIVWINYITFFNSRVVGKVVTRILNRFVSEGYIKVRTNSSLDESLRFIYNTIFWLFRARSRAPRWWGRRWRSGA